MAELISSLLSPVFDNLISTAASLLKEEIGLVLHVKKDVERLKSNLSSIKAVLEDAEQRQLKELQLRDWLGKLKNVAYDAEDILKTFATEAALLKRKQKIKKIGHQYDAANKIKELSERIEVISKEKDRFHLQEKEVDDGMFQKRPQTNSNVDVADVFGREDDKDNIQKLLLNAEYDQEGDICVIPIIGMAGLGKTTLAKLLYNDEKVMEKFQDRRWGCVTVDFDLERILKEILKPSKDEDKESISDLETCVLNDLRNKRYLLVLDDVWTEDYTEWERLHKLLKQGDKSSRVLVTSRSNKVAKVVGTESPYLPECLPQDKSWSLFQKIVFNHRRNFSGEVQKELEKIGSQIVAKCKGLPLAIKAMAGLLHNEDNVSKWQKILISSVWELELEGSSNVNKPNILPALKLSYDHLPSYLKQCFAYCSIFPKAFVFDKEELVKIWIAQGFVHCRGQEKDEDIGMEYFDELCVRFFFQRSTMHSIEQSLEKSGIDDFDFNLKEVIQHSNIDKIRYQMHDLVHDLAQLVSSSECCQVKDHKSCSISPESRHVSFLCEDVEKPVLSIVESCKKLRTLIFLRKCLENIGQSLDIIFHKLKYLRLLDLSSSKILILPKSVEKLKLLHYLDLSQTEIRELPDSICNLYNLQTLKLLGCPWIFNLPKKFGNLVNLRHLELDAMFWFKLSSCPPRIGNLTFLHNLHAFQVNCNSGYGIDELKKMAFLTGTLHISKLENAANAEEAKMKEKQYLHKVVLEWSNKNVDTQDVLDEGKQLEDLQPHSNLKQLEIVNYTGISFPHWLTDGQLQKLVTISLNGCTSCRILSLGQLPDLYELYIKRMSNLEKWPNNSYPSLRRLKISNCPKLSEIPHVFQNLRVMKIKKCCSLTALPLSPSLAFLILVDNLFLEDWNEKIVQNAALHRPSFIGVLEMKVINCPKLQDLPIIFSPQKLEISGCELVNTLPRPELSRRIQQLALDTCHDGRLVRAIPHSESMFSLVISNISNLDSVSRWPKLPALEVLYISDCKDLVNFSGEGSLKSLTSLKLLSIRGCSKLTDLPEEELPTSLECLMICSCSNLRSLGREDTLRRLKSLKDLYIEDCPLLQSFPEDGLPASLQHLLIQKCPLLTAQCRNEDGEGPEWPKIMNIPDLEIDLMDQYLPKKKTSSVAWCYPLFHGRQGSRVKRQRENGNRRIFYFRNVVLDNWKAILGTICFHQYRF